MAERERETERGSRGGHAEQTPEPRYERQPGEERHPTSNADQNMERSIPCRK